MNYIVFINKNGSEKLAISTNVNCYYEISERLAKIINRLCNENNYAYQLTGIINKKTPIIEEKLFNV